MKVLVVEADLELLAMYCTMINSLGHKVIKATGDIKTLEILKNTPDVRAVITEVSMPQGSGPKLLKNIFST